MPQLTRRQSRLSTKAAASPAALPSQSGQADKRGFIGPFDLPPKATLWGFVMFLGEEEVEVSISNNKDSKAVLGQFAGPRIAEFSWQNSSAEAEQLAFRGKAVTSGQELFISGVRGTGNESQIIGFGLRGTPERSPSRSFPHEAVLAAFVVYDSP